MGKTSEADKGSKKNTTEIVNLPLDNLETTTGTSLISYISHNFNLDKKQIDEQPSKDKSINLPSSFYLSHL